MLLALGSAVFLWSERPLGLATIFYCLGFETSLFVASYDSQGHGGDISPSLSDLSRAEQSSSLLPATSQYGHSWHRTPLGPMAIYLFSVKTFVFSYFRCSSFDKERGVGHFFIIGVPLLHIIPPEVTLK
jgi:hypothetical protein